MRKLLISMSLLGIATSANARDYGQQGAVFPLIERDLLAQIQSRLVAMENSGETHRLNAELKRRTIARVNRPEPVAGLAAATQTRSWAFDPTSTLAADIRGAKGELIWAKGARVNPLDSVPLRAPLLFIDGDDPDQLGWALQQNARVKLILTRGAPLMLMKANQRRFYFDQGGKLVKHFGIGALPARVVQQGRMLQISEIALPPKAGARP